LAEKGYPALLLGVGCFTAVLWASMRSMAFSPRGLDFESNGLAVALGVGEFGQSAPSRPSWWKAFRNKLEKRDFLYRAAFFSGAGPHNLPSL
jgi:hypothetical protein